MSRYRPIAPKPETSPNSSSMTDGSSSSLSQKIKQSPYLRNLWPQLQARPTRTRKRGRAPLTLPPSSSLKRHKTTHVLGFCPPCHVTSPAKNLSLQSFSSHTLPLTHHNHALGVGVLNCTIENNNTHNNPTNLVTLPLLPCSPSPALKLDSTTTTTTNPCDVHVQVLDLNTKVNVPEEKDLLQLLQKPVSNNVNVIAPQPIRPIGSSISVVCVSEDSTLPPLPQTPKPPHEVEQVVESETMPAVISDSNHKIRMANSAYKEMVGQPLCPWLESMAKGSDEKNPLQYCKRISGEVTLHLCDSNIPTSSNGFSCWVRIEWQSEHNKKNCVNAFCDVVKLCCDSRDYFFTWRFHTRTREGL